MYQFPQGVSPDQVAQALAAPPAQPMQNPYMQTAASIFDVPGPDNGGVTLPDVKLRASGNDGKTADFDFSELGRVLRALRETRQSFPAADIRIGGFDTKGRGVAGGGNGPNLMPKF